MMMENADEPAGETEDVSRDEEQGEASEPDAPTDEEENEGMNTVLSPEPFTGVQDDAGKE